MRYSADIEHSEQGLSALLETVVCFESDAVLDGVIECNLNEYSVKQLTLFVKEHHCILLQETVVLEKFAEDFNQQFATDSNKCFSTAEHLFKQMRKTLKGTTRVYLSFCKRNHRQLPGRFGKAVSALDHSFVGRRSHQCFFENMDSKSVEGPIRELCDELETFFTDLRKAIVLCMGVMSDERFIRANIKQLHKIYTECWKKIEAEQQFAISRETECDRKLAEDALSRFKREHTYEEFLVYCFHNYDLRTFIRHVVYEVVQKALRMGYDQEELELWGIVPDVKVYRYIIEHFDELDPKGQKARGKEGFALSPLKLAWFVDWSKAKNETLLVNVYFREKYHGKYHTVKANSVCTARYNVIRKRLDVTKERTAFFAKLDAMKQRFYAEEEISKKKLA